MKLFRSRLVVAASILLVSASPAFANENKPLYPGFPAVQESIAYKQFRNRPGNERSKLLYLIDRFSTADIKIVFDGIYYATPMVARIARWFLANNYSKETAEKWVMIWCNQSAFTGQIIWVQLPDGKFKLAREVLLEELEALNALLAQGAAKGVPPSAIASGSVASELTSGSSNLSLVQGAPPTANTTK